MNKEKKFIQFIDWVINELSLDNDDVATNIYNLIQQDSICLPWIWSFNAIMDALKTEILHPELSMSSDFWREMFNKYKIIYNQENTSENKKYKFFLKGVSSYSAVKDDSAVKEDISIKYDGTCISRQIIGGPLMGLFINISIDKKDRWSFEIDNKALFETSILVVNKTKKWWFNEITRFEYKF